MSGILEVLEIWQTHSPDERGGKVHAWCAVQCEDGDYHISEYLNQDQIPCCILHRMEARTAPTLHTALKPVISLPSIAEAHVFIEVCVKRLQQRHVSIAPVYRGPLNVPDFLNTTSPAFPTIDPLVTGTKPAPFSDTFAERLERLRSGLTTQTIGTDRTVQLTGEHRVSDTLVTLVTLTGKAVGQGYIHTCGPTLAIVTPLCDVPLVEFLLVLIVGKQATFTVGSSVPWGQA